MKPGKYHIVTVAACLLAFSAVLAQSTSPSVAPPPHGFGPNDTLVVFATQLPDGTWVPTSALPDAECIGKMPKWMANERKKWSRLRNAVYVTYPYAQSAARVITDINAQLNAVYSEKERKRIIKAKEKELKEAFGDKVTNLSVYQGKVLMKLINRQTGFNCYEILKEYKGGANARFWQTIAFFFGSNLKQPYNPKGDDAEMENIVQEVERMYFPYRG